jgi:RimJ/RimL family protein N-acetyltransferase
VITTSRLLLRRWQPSDKAPFAALNADPEVMRYFPSARDARQSGEMVDRFEAGFDAHGYGLWALERLDSGEFIGFTGLTPMIEGIPGSGGVEIGWRLARAHWRQGFATEAAEAALEFAFVSAEFDEVHSVTAAVNEPSRRVMRRIGLRHIDDFVYPGIDESSPLRAHVRYRIRRAEWKALRQAQGVKGRSQGVKGGSPSSGSGR